MKVTYEQFNTALVAALDAVSAGRGAEPRFKRALLAFADSLGIEVSGESALTASVKREARAATAVDCTPEHGVGHSDCPKCWRSSPRNPHAGTICTCNPYAQENCPVPGCVGGQQVPHWVPRTWVDVRVGDVVRMPGQEATAAEVMELVTLGWHVNDIPPAQLPYESDHDYAERVKAFNKDVQYRPNEHAGQWTARPVTLRPLVAADPATRHRIPNVNPGAPVEIRCTQVEIDAIELLGGWSQRVAVASTPA